MAGDLVNLKCYEGKLPQMAQILKKSSAPSAVVTPFVQRLNTYLSLR